MLDEYYSSDESVRQNPVAQQLHTYLLHHPPTLDQLQDFSVVLHTGELRLMWAILYDGVSRFLRNCNQDSRRARRLFREEEKWIMSSDMKELYSFEYICSALGLDPGYIRRGLMQRVEELRSTKRVWHKPMRDPITHKGIS